MAVPFAAACGGGSSPSDTPPVTATATATPTPAGVRTVLQTSPFDGIGSGDVFRIEVDLIPAGVVDTTVTWGEGTNMAVYVTTPSCVSGREAISGVCRRIAFATGSSRPKTLRFENPGVETYYYYLHNEGPGRASGQMEAALTR